MRRLVIMAALLLAFAPVAKAADAHDLRLDTAASWAAGHPVQVYCEDSWQEWYGFGYPQFESFTQQGQPWIWLDPKVCDALSSLANGRDVGTYYASSALLALAHESSHQFGLVDEGQTDCRGLLLVTQLATQFFGIAPKVAVKHYKVVRGKLRVTTTMVVNPWLTKMRQDAEFWHRRKPPEYQGGC